MTKERYTELMDNDRNEILTEQELSEGWHWCFDFDGLLVGPAMEMEWSCCTCHESKQGSP